MTGVLAVLLLSFHLVCMNIASAGPLVGIWLEVMAARGKPAALRAGPWLAWKSLQLALIGALLGLALGWLQWDAEFAAVLQRFGSRVRWGILEFLFSAILTAVYALWWWWRPQAGRGGRVIRSLIAVISATNLLYHFPPLFTLIAQATAGRIDPGVVDSATFRRLLVAGEVIPLTAHFALASVAVSGVALIGLAWRASATPRPCPEAAIWGSRIALGATLAQIPVGIWLLLAVPGGSQQRLLGGDLIASSLFLASMLGTFGLLHLLAAVGFGEPGRRGMLLAIVGMLLVVVAMSGVLHRLG